MHCSRNMFSNFLLNFHQVSTGKLKSLVDKFTAVNRVYGLLIVTTLTVDPVLGPVIVPEESRILYCHAIDVALFFLSLSFWSNNIIIACTRSALMKVTKTHNIQLSIDVYRKLSFSSFWLR